MATAHIVWFGVVVEFSHQEITQITSTMNSGAAGAGALGAVLGGMGIIGTGAVITGIVGALLKVGATLLTGCNSKQTGIYLWVLWVGVPWCRSR
jgi:predicted MFS family arabinose efflux permease